MIEIELSSEFRDKIKDYTMILIEADVVNSETPERLAAELDRLAKSMASVMEIADINRRPAIAATRRAYKILGKEPNRYRPSQEQMSRRILKGLGLYRVNALVDLGNLLSLKSGNSIGVFDKAKIKGDKLTLGIGRDGEEYTGIGRGALNIANLPVQRDAEGGIGTPTSDHERTAVSLDTRRIVMTIHCYGFEMSAEEIVAEARRLLSSYAFAENFEYKLIR